MKKLLFALTILVTLFLSPKTKGFVKNIERLTEKSLVAQGYVKISDDIDISSIVKQKNNFANDFIKNLLTKFDIYYNEKTDFYQGVRKFDMLTSYMINTQKVFFHTYYFDSHDCICSGSASLFSDVVDDFCVINDGYGSVRVDNVQSFKTKGDSFGTMFPNGENWIVGVGSVDIDPNNSWLKGMWDNALSDSPEGFIF